MALQEGGPVGLENSEGAENNEVRKDTNVPVLRKEPSFSRWSHEIGIDSSETSNNLLNNSKENSDFELPTLGVDESQDEVLDRDEKSLVKINRLENRSNSFRHRSIHTSEGHGGNDSINRDDTGSPRNHENATGDGKKLSSVYIEHENSSRSGSPRLWGSPRERSFRNLEIGNSDLKNFNESSQTNQSFMPTAVMLRTLFFIFIWYTFSTCLTLYNKSLLGDQLGKFPAPLLMNTVHFAMQAVLSKVILCFWSQRLETTGVMSWRDYFMRVVPTALGTAVDINLSNASLVSISVTFATMCKSASPVFLLLFAFAFKLEAPSLELLGIIFIISSGVLLTVAKETEFQFWGFVFVMLAAVMSGFRWSMTQILLQRETYGLKNPITFMSSVAPVMTLATAFLSLLFDPWVHFKQNIYFDDSSHIFRSCLLMSIGGGLAFFMVLTEYILVSATSAVTVTIAGVVKEAVTIVVAVFYFHDQFTLLKGVGLFTIMVGVSLFNWYKYQKLQKGSNESGEFIGSTNDIGTTKYVILDNMDDMNEEA